jgi:hypothetical protein
MKIEILITQSSKSNLCKDKKSLIHLLQADSNIVISGSKLKYSNVDFQLKISILKVSSVNHQCFHMTIETSDENIEKLFNLKNLLVHHLRSVLGNTPQVIWDDIDTYYSEKAYLIIKEIENLMRKCLTQFCLVNAGLGWIKETIPSQLDSKMKRNGNELDSNYLAGTDFIDLSIILFSKYTKHETQAIFDKIKTTDNIQSIIDMLPKSNWERYFEEHITLDESKLEKNWEELYILRCKVAHNKSFTKKDLDELERLSGIVKPIILSAISKLDIIEIPDEEKESVILSNAINLPESENESNIPSTRESFTPQTNLGFNVFKNNTELKDEYINRLTSLASPTLKQYAALATNGLASRLIADALDSPAARFYNELTASQKISKALDNPTARFYRELATNTRASVLATALENQQAKYQNIVGDQANPHLSDFAQPQDTLVQKTSSNTILENPSESENTLVTNQEQTTSHSDEDDKKLKK